MSQKTIYHDYIQNIKDIVGNVELQKSFSSNEQLWESKQMTHEQADKISGIDPGISLRDLAQLLNINVIKAPVLGDHPDFKHLRHQEGFPSDYHYIVSMFIDVKGSTNFHKKYSLNQIGLINQTIILAAIHTCALFGGHIQRLQGDGVFTYFGGRQTKKNVAVQSAINAAAFFTYFIKYELAGIFALDGIDKIDTRIGIDFGEDYDVQWAIFGSGSCTELTTNSLHTSLASKMQANASPNGIVVGKNIKDKMGQADIFTDYIRDNSDNIDESKRYIYKDANKNFNYSQHKFLWSDYLLKSFPFIKKDDNDNIFIDYDYDETAFRNELNRLDILKKTTDNFSSNKSYLDKTGNINTLGSGVIIPNNRFYFEND